MKSVPQRLKPRDLKLNVCGTAEAVPLSQTVCGMKIYAVVSRDCMSVDLPWTLPTCMKWMAP